MAVRRFGPPPAWFYDVYDAISQNLPIGNYRSIREQPLYIRFRYRLVQESLKESRINMAVKAKAQGVIDISNL